MRASETIFKGLYVILFISSGYVVIFFIDFLLALFSLHKYLIILSSIKHEIWIFAFYYILLFNSLLSLILFLKKKKQFFLIWTIFNFTLFLIVSILIIMSPDFSQLTK
jgi:hypothetical protein